MTKLLEIELFRLDDYSFKVLNIVSVVIFIVIAASVIALMKRLIYRSRSLDPAKKFAVNKLLSYVITTISLLICIQLLGFDISVLLAGSAAILVGLGFGLQNLFNDFISGIILLVDRTLKIDDIIEVNDIIYKVLEINFRTTTVLGRNGNYVILPNSELTKNEVINWTHNQIASRFNVKIGVDYSTDITLLMDVLTKVAKSNINILASPEPVIRFEDFGDSSLNFSIYFYTDEIFGAENIKSELRIAIFHALKTHNITIPFPQRVLHVSGATKPEIDRI